MRAVAYCRVSTERQARNNDSLPLQERECRAFCSRSDYELVKVFCEAESATTMVRPALQSMLTFCETQGVEVVVVYALSRLSREEVDRLQLRSHFRRLGIILRSVTEPMIDDTDLGEFNETILGGMAQLENRIRMRRTIAGMKSSTEQGNWNHQAPLGYQNGKLNGKKVILPDTRGANVLTGQTTADLVSELFKVFSTGSYTIEAVKRHVTSLGLRTKKGKPLSAQSIRKMLTNPFYTGVVREKNGSKPKRYKVDHWDIQTSGNHVALVDTETWAEVQRLLGKRSSVHAAPRLRANPSFPLARFVRCGSCGRPLRGYMAKRKYPTYDCQNRHCRDKAKGNRRKCIRSS